eukprot:TRINITY_DN5224_c0_g1_i2.p1 TRINITY_DN5224_c0_g1~~TRINITY_DN5224_c0_g1_i2.p1  ORF type:complete len:130 (+),score=9.67 TRINITY_DN5224_c0_g1_i2:109-498(+)
MHRLSAFIQQTARQSCRLHPLAPSPRLTTRAVTRPLYYNYFTTRAFVTMAPTIVKSENDSREYLGFTLDNNLRVICVSDPTTDKSAAALDVAVGHFSDPDELPGLAHFCEVSRVLHMYISCIVVACASE